MTTNSSIHEHSGNSHSISQKNKKKERKWFRYASSFKSSLLENYYRKLTLPYMKALLRKLLVIFCMYNCCIYFLLTGIYYETTFYMISQSIVTFLFMISLILTVHIKSHSMLVAISLISFLSMIIESMSSIYGLGKQMEIAYTPIMHIILVIFTILPWDLFISIPISLLSVTFMIVVTSIRISNDSKCPNKTLSNTITKARRSKYWNLHEFRLNDYAVFQILLWLTLFINGIYLFLSNRIWRRLSFLNLGQHLHAKKKSEAAMKGQLHWIDAIMPTVVREEYWTNFEDARIGKWCYVKEFEPVSILYADIVGFTKMSSNKSALDIVKLLNDLFNRFDNLSIRQNCEKLGTLGDCYYCVAGCPLPRHDHAFCCVEMGIGMCKIIKKFNKIHKESVGMRVGVHSGKVNAAILGKNRIHFDVYSNDALIANAVETSGKPGKVHITESVLHLLSYVYSIEPGERLTIKREENQALAGMQLTEVTIKTFFINPDIYHANIGDDNKNVNLNLKLTKSKSAIVDYEDISFGSHDDNVDIVNIRKKKQRSEDMEEVFAQSIKETNDTQQISALDIPVNFITLVFNDSEIEWHYHNHVFDQVQDVETHSIKFSPCIEAFLSLICLTALVFGVLRVYHIEDSIIKMCSGLVLCLKFELCIIELWKASTYYCLIKLKILKIIYKLLCHELTKAIICVMSMTLPNLFVLLFFDCKRNSNNYYFQARFFSMSLFAMSIGSINAESILLVKILSLFLNYIAVLFTTILTDCSDFEKVNKNIYSTSTCMGYYTYVTEGFFITNNRFHYLLQITLTFIILIFIVREREMGQRRWFYLTREAEIFHEEALRQMHVERDFLFNIIPKYVFQYIKQSTNHPHGKAITAFNYAMNVKKAAVVFACISNFFAKYYREDYKSGIMALNLLNQIITQMDGLLEKPRYKNVEKIKTINDCYMLASGLNVEETLKNKDPKSHLKALMFFSFDMLKLLIEFNDKFIIGNDQFEMKIGYNIGSVTAGIIGIKKPMYDIWGDTVNVASRMYSTGQPGTIQVPDYVVEELQDQFNFQFRDSILVKGKGKMKTYTCTRKQI